MRLPAFILIAGCVSLAACSSPEAPETVPETAATAPAGATPAEPGVGSTPDPGGGVPGSSLQAGGNPSPDGTVSDPPLPRETPAP
ncbi:hypothetical protein [Brevundimonas sp. R86498]|uniref:hypothetical protein n=1 Tax=Brevundimonas sp. R86498 TaxID=3093845 RepID=UPI0037C648F9